MSDRGDASGPFVPRPLASRRSQRRGTRRVLPCARVVGVPRRWPRGIDQEKSRCAAANQEHCGRLFHALARAGRDQRVQETPPSFSLRFARREARPVTPTPPGARTRGASCAEPCPVPQRMIAVRRLRKRSIARTLEEYRDVFAKRVALLTRKAPQQAGRVSSGNKEEARCRSGVPCMSEYVGSA